MMIAKDEIDKGNFLFFLGRMEFMAATLGQLASPDNTEAHELLAKIYNSIDNLKNKMEANYDNTKT